ncbi:MAG: DUF3243 family protein [Proteobacteria bacterium]|nr:DUF3243 family protein [Pseudomonadota bacterium]
METTKCINAMDFVKDWETWRSTLHEGIAEARKFGVSDEVIKEMGVKIGDFLAKKICPATKEEELLRKFWDVGTPEERKAIASMMFKLAENDH